MAAKCAARAASPAPRRRGERRRAATDARKSKPSTKPSLHRVAKKTRKEERSSRTKGKSTSSTRRHRRRCRSPSPQPACPAAARTSSCCVAPKQQPSTPVRTPRLLSQSSAYDCSPRAIPKHDVTLHEQEEAAEGGFGVVRFGTSRCHGPVVVKVPRVAHSPQLRFGLVREMRAHVDVGCHPNLVRLLGFLSDMEDASSFALSGGLVFERWSADCWDLIAAVSPEGSGCRLARSPEVVAGVVAALMPRGYVPVVARVLLGCARGLRHLHERGVVHGDLSPGNVLLRFDADGEEGEEGEEWVGQGVEAAIHDLGLAVRGCAGRPHDKNAAEEPDEQATARYMFHMPLCGPAEPTLTPAFDVYSLGALIAALLTRCQRVPLDLLRAGVGALYEAHRQRAGRLVAPGQEGCVHALLELAAWCLQRDPAARPTAEQAMQYVEDVRACLA